MEHRERLESRVVADEDLLILRAAAFVLLETYGTPGQQYGIGSKLIYHTKENERFLLGNQQYDHAQKTQEIEIWTVVAGDAPSPKGLYVKVSTLQGETDENNEYSYWVTTTYGILDDGYSSVGTEYLRCSSQGTVPSSEPLQAGYPAIESYNLTQKQREQEIDQIVDMLPYYISQGDYVELSRVVADFNQMNILPVYDS